MTAEAWGYEPRRVAVCTCGFAARAADLRAVSALIDRHLADACEGVDHALFVEDVREGAR